MINLYFIFKQKGSIKCTLQDITKLQLHLKYNEVFDLLISCDSNLKFWVSKILLSKRITKKTPRYENVKNIVSINFDFLKILLKYRKRLIVLYSLIFLNLNKKHDAICVFIKKLNYKKN